MPVSRGSMPRKWVWMAVGTLLAVSLTLRLVGIGWGIPHYDAALMPYTEYRHSYHLDEGKFLWGLTLMEPSAGNFDVSLHHWGTLQFYLIYGALLIGSAVGVVPAPWERAFLSGNVDALPMMYVLGRLVSVLMGVAGTLLVIALGKALGGWRAGLGAGAAYAVAPLAVVGAHYLTNDITMSALLAGSVYAGVRAVQTGNGRWLFGAGLLLGLATSAKYSAAFGAFALVVAQTGFLVNERQSAASRMVASDGSEGDAGRNTLTRMLMVLALPWLGAVIGFLVGEPYALLTPHILKEGLQQASQGNAFDPTQGLGPPLEMLGWQARNLAEFGMTLPLALLAVGGVGVLALRGRRMADDGRRLLESRRQKAEGRRALRNKRYAIISRITHHASRFTLSSVVLRPSSVVIAALLGLMVGLALNRIHMLRYTHVLLPLAAVCAGIGWAAISPALLRWGVGALALAVAGWITLGQLSMMSGAHPANSLLSWLQANLRPGDEVASLWPEYPLLDQRKYQLVRIDPWRPDVAPDDRPDYIILDDMALGPLGQRLTSVVANEYNEVARFGSRPQVLGNSWDEGDTPHDWKYSHPTFRVYARK
jgi:hypothetical protein